MKIALYVIRRSWMIILLMCIAVLFITVNTRINLEDDSWGIEIGPDNSAQTDVSVGNVNGTKELVPIGTVSNSNQTDVYALRFAVNWSSENLSTNLVGNLGIIVSRIAIYDGNYLVTTNHDDTRLNDWVSYKIVGEQQVTLNTITDIIVEIRLNDPGLENRDEMRRLLAGRRLVLGFSFEVNIGSI